MRKITWFSILAASALVAVLAAPALLATPANQAPDKVTIDDCVVKRKAVEFPHGTHAKAFECKTCHHTQEALTATSTEAVKACGSCHNTPEKAETPKCSEMSASKNHFHINCINCHKETVAKDATKKAPTKCDDCHPKT